MYLLTANNVVGYVTGTTACPQEKIGTADAATENPEYVHWCRQDNHVSLALLGSCGPEAQIVMSSAMSSADAWARLNKAYSNRSRARVMSLKERLASVSKGSSNSHDYLHTIRSVGGFVLWRALGYTDFCFFAGTSQEWIRA